MMRAAFHFAGQGDPSEARCPSCHHAAGTLQAANIIPALILVDVLLSLSAILRNGRDLPEGVAFYWCEACRRFATFPAHKGPQEGQA